MAASLSMNLIIESIVVFSPLNLRWKPNIDLAIHGMIQVLVPILGLMMLKGVIMYKGAPLTQLAI